MAWFKFLRTPKDKAEIRKRNLKKIKAIIEAVLEVHHKDSDRTNNELENLDVLCPTHHTEYQLGIRKY
jgi:hypothetical protein